MKNKKNFIIIGGILAVCILAAICIFIAVYIRHNGVSITFSKDSGFYENDIELTLTATEKDAAIYVTTDGSTPTLNSPCYTEPFTITLTDRSSEDNVLSAKTGTSFVGDYVPEDPVEKATVIRAFAMTKDGKQSNVITNTYFVGEEFTEKYKDITVLSLSIDPDEFYSDETGIYVRGDVYNDWIADGGDEVNTPIWEMPANFTQKGRNWERNIHMELFEDAQSVSLSQDLGVRILGGASRALEQKSLKFYARKDYGKGCVDYELFPGDTKNCDKTTALHTYDTFAIRNGGNDSWMTKFRNRYIQLLVNDRAFTTQETRPAIVFLNGEYWGIYTMQDDYSDNYIYRNYDIDKTNVVMIKLGTIEEGTDTDQQLYDDLINFAEKNDLSVQENYEKISNMLDIQSFIDYFCTEIYIANGDWLNHDNNYRMWRSRTTSDKPYEDGKWRYMLYDTEYSMGIYSQGMDYDLNSLENALTMPADCPGTQVVLFSNLLKNDGFKMQFVNTFMDMVNSNFTTDHMNTLLDQVVKEYEPFMGDYFARFGNTYPNAGSDPIDAFYTSLDELKLFISKRNDYIPTMLNKTLELNAATQELTVNLNDPNAGDVQINTISPDFSNGAFTGSYFDSIQVTLEAQPKDGYEFTGWSGDIESNEETLTITISEAKSVQANFRKQ